MSLRALFTDDALLHSVLAAVSMLTYLEAIVVDGSFAAVRYRERGSFRAPFRGQAVTGRFYEMLLMEWFDFRHGKISQRFSARRVGASDSTRPVTRLSPRPNVVM